MKIKRRDFPIASFCIWAIPLCTYILQKINGVVHNDSEWLWWVIIPILFIGWFLVSFKITLRDKVTLDHKVTLIDEEPKTYLLPQVYKIDVCKCKSIDDIILLLDCMELTYTKSEHNTEEYEKIKHLLITDDEE